MAQVQERAKAIRTQWASVLPQLRETEPSLAPQLQGLTVDQLNSTITTLLDLLERVRAPQELRPGFHTAQTFADLMLVSVSQAIQALTRAEYTHLASLVASVTQALGAVSVMLVFSDKQHVGELERSLTASLAESRIQLDQAREGLVRSRQESESAAEVFAKASDEAAVVSTLRAQADSTVNTMSTAASQASEALTSIQQQRAAAENDRRDIQSILSESRELQKVLEEERRALTDIRVSNEKQTALISDLLPKGTSAGLAYSFGMRRMQLEKTKWLWGGLFFVSVAALSGIAYLMIQAQDVDHAQLWLRIIERLPLAAPAVWLGWFSAIQYGNTLRVQEDYAFKEATSNAFAGYRDHLQFLADVSTGDGENAAELLAIRTIEILAMNPLRVFQTTDKDASPSSSVKDMFSGVKQPGAPKADREA